MSVFFQFIAGIALFFGIAAFVFATEISKRCQQIIDARLDEIENEVARRINRQDEAITEAVKSVRNTMSSFEEAQFAQTREINALRKTLEALTDDLKKKEEEEKKRLASLAHRRF